MQAAVPRASSIIVVMVLAGLVLLPHAAASNENTPLVQQYPVQPKSLQPVLIYIKGGEISDAELNVTLQVTTSIKASLIQVPECSGSQQVEITVHLNNGKPAANAVILIENKLNGDVCSAYADANGKAIINLDKIGVLSYTAYAFYDVDNDGLYEYAGSADIAASSSLVPTPPTEIDITVKPLIEQVSTDFYNMSNIELSIKQPMIRIPGYYVSAIPGLVAFDAKLSIGNLPVLQNMEGINELYISTRSKVKYTVTAEGKVIGGGEYMVEPGPADIDLPPLAVAIVSDALTDPSSSVMEETFGLSPSGWSCPSGEQLNVTVIAFDDRRIEDMRFYVAVNGTKWSTIPLNDLPVMEALNRLGQYYSEVAALVGKLLSLVSTLGVDLGFRYNITLPALELKYVLIPGQKAGSFILFRAYVSDGNHSFVTPTGLYYVYNKDAEKRILVVDPNILIWLIKYNAKIYRELIYSGYLAKLPIVSDYAKEAYTNEKVRQLMRIVDAAQPFHHWEYLGTTYQIRILANLSKLSEELQEYRPNVIILSNLWLGLNASDSKLFNWDLHDLEQDDDLISYIKENHAGLIITHATLSDLIVWTSKDEKVKIMPRGHVGYTLENVSIVNEKTIAGTVGLGMLPVYEYLRDKVAEQLTQSPEPETRALGQLIGSIPLLVPWVPWDGRLVETNSTKYLGWNIPDTPIEIPNPYMEINSSIKAYTLVGWQLGSPIVGIQAAIEALPHIANKARQYYERLDGIIANITGEDLDVGRHLYESLAGRIKLVYDMLANASVTGVRGEVEANIGGTRIHANITLPSRLIEQLVLLIPVKLAAVSPNGLAGIVTYDRYWDPSSGFRAVYFSFEIEAGINDAARQLLLEAVNWTLAWKPIDLNELLRNVTRAILQDVGGRAGELLENARALAYNVTLATARGGILEYQLDAGTYYIVVKGMNNVDIDVEGAIVESVNSLAPGIKLVTVRTDEPGKLRLVLRGENGPALVLLLKKIAETKGYEEILRQVIEQLQRRAKKALAMLPGSLELNTTLAFEGGKQLSIPVAHGKAYIVISCNDTLNLTVNGGRAIIEELEPGLYVAAVYTGRPGEIILHLYAGGKVVASIVAKSALPADINGDGIVDYHDLAIIAKAYGSSRGAEAYSLVADINCDGVVDYRDLAILAARYGTHLH